jgi:hypothetical protein
MSEAIAFPETRTNEAEQLADRFARSQSERSSRRQRATGPRRLPWRLTMYPTARFVRTSGGILAPAEA